MMDKLQVIVRPGAPIVNAAHVITRHNDVIVLSLDMKSKYCEVVTTFGSSLMIAATPHSLHLNEGVNRIATTQVDFPQLKDWEIHSVDSSRYTINVTFLNRTGFDDSSPEVIEPIYKPWS